MHRRALELMRSLGPELLRAAAMTLAAFAFARDLVGGFSLAATALLAGAGTAIGQRIGRSRLRLSVMLAASLVADILSWRVAAILTGTGLAARVLGPSTTLAVTEVLRLGTLAVTTTALLRATAVRRPTFVLLEIGALAAAVVGAFASHREGVVSRPLWLSDLAWHYGIDPTTALLTVGTLTAGLLVVLILIQNRPGRTAASLVTVGAWGLLAVLFINVAGLTQQATSIGEAPVTTSTQDVPPPPPFDAGQWTGGGGPDAEPTDGRSGDGGNEDAGVDAASDRTSTDATAESGAGSGADHGGSPPPPPPSASSPPSSPPSAPPSAASSPPPPDDRSRDDGPARPVAVVVLEDDGPDPPGHVYYFRQGALSQYNGTRLVQTGRADADRDVLVDFAPEAVDIADLSRAADGGLVSPRREVHQRIGLLVPHNGPFGLDAMTRFEPLSNPEPARFDRVFRATSVILPGDYRQFFGRGVGDPSWSADLRDHYTQGPEDPRYLQMALRMIGHLKPSLQDDPFAKAATIKVALDHELSYSSKVRFVDADPTADMLFGSKIGYCVHFAHAAVFLWRSLGIPARVAVGYGVDEDERKGSAIVILGDRAHAWPEIYVTGVGWVDLDIHAERNLDPPRTKPDEDLVRLMGDILRASPPEGHTAPTSRTSLLRTAGRTALAAFAAVLLLLYATKAWRRLAPSFVSPRALPRAAYRAALDELSAHGYVRELGESREQFAVRVRSFAPSFERLTGLYLAFRLRAVDATSPARPEFSLAAWRLELASLRAEVAKRHSLFNRLLGLANPLSFNASR